MGNTIVDGLTTVILSLKPRERRRLITRLVDSHVLSEDEEDRLLIEQRKDEISIPFREVVKELKEKGRLK